MNFKLTWQLFTLTKSKAGKENSEHQHMVEGWHV